MKDDKKRGETPRFLFRFSPRKYKYLAWVLCQGFPYRFYKVLLVKAERDHKSFVDLSHCAVGQIADFVF